MSSPTRFPNGLTTAKKKDLLGEFILPDITTAHVYMEDFNYYNAANWTVTEVGVATQALVDIDGGVLQISNAAADDNLSFQQKVGESFLFQAGKKLWFDCKFNVNNAIESDFVIGLQITDTTPLDVSDGVFFIKNDGVATVDLVVEKDNTATTTSSVATIAASTNIRLGFFYNGKDKIQVFVDGVTSGSSIITNLPDDEALTISFGIQNGNASASIMMVDYIMAAKER